MKSIDPTTGELVAEYAEHSPQEVNVILETAHDAFTDWRRLSYGERAGYLQKTAEALEAHREEWAKLMAVEMGKPIGAGLAEVDKCAWVCRYYADEAEMILADRHIEAGRRKSYVHHEPLGVVLAVMPWNFPFWQVLRFAAPALMAGNTSALKHSSNVTGCALAIEQAFREAGLPDGAFRALLIPGERVNEVIAHPRIAAVTLTGSDPAGRAVASQAGANLKKTVLELGGSDPHVVLEDADLQLAAASCATGRLINSGQSCIGAKRFIVHEAVYNEWLALFVERMSSAVMGNPLDPDTEVGPQARHDLRDELHHQVSSSVESGATVILGGEIPEGPGAFYPPTILTGVKPGMPAYDEELFGPVASVIKVDSEQEAIRVANDTEFGLGASVYTRDLERGERIAARYLEAGSCFVNAFVASDPRLPFGGIKTSGYGRELADLGIKEFVNAKTVVVA